MKKILNFLTFMGIILPVFAVSAQKSKIEIKVSLVTVKCLGVDDGKRDNDEEIYGRIDVRRPMEGDGTKKILNQFPESRPSDYLPDDIDQNKNNNNGGIIWERTRNGAVRLKLNQSYYGTSQGVLKIDAYNTEKLVFIGDLEERDGKVKDDDYIQESCNETQKTYNRASYKTIYVQNIGKGKDAMVETLCFSSSGTKIEVTVRFERIN